MAFSPRAATRKWLFGLFKMLPIVHFLQICSTFEQMSVRSPWLFCRLYLLVCFLLTTTTTAAVI